MNVFAKFDEIPSVLLQDIKETKRYGHTFVRSFVRSDNVKTVNPPTNCVCGGYKKGGPGRSVSNNICSSVILSEMAIKGRESILEFRILTRQSIKRLI